MNKVNGGGLVEKVKDFAKDHVWALGFGVLNGATSGAYTSNGQEVVSSLFWFGLVTPVIQKTQGSCNNYIKKRAIENTLTYFAAYNATQLILYQRI